MEKPSYLGDLEISYLINCQTVVCALLQQLLFCPVLESRQLLAKMDASEAMPGRVPEGNAGEIPALYQQP